tara:strand:- start:733 stop:1281 length:549 start_codon:yes stop_codon:yes gene_type:complete
MKKVILAIISIFILVSACSFETKELSTSGGTTYTQQKLFIWEEDIDKCAMDEIWYASVRHNTTEIPARAIADCYTRKMEVYELCLEWDRIYEEYYNENDDILKFRKAMSISLQDRNEDPLKCRNPNNDNKVKLEKELQKAKRRAAAAEAKAAAAEAASQQQSCTYVETLNPNGTTYYRKVCN